MNEIQNQNPILRFLDDQTAETIKNIKEAAIENQKTIDALKKTLCEAHIRITQIIQNL